jgi:hypothetical protein
LAVLILASLCFPAWAQGAACVKRSDLVKHLESQYREQPRFHGMTDNGSLLEVFTSPDGGTWTVTVSIPNGISCMVASGQQWDVTIPHPVEESL